MRVFQVRQGGTGAILWTGEARGELEALDVMAKAAGYDASGALPESVRGRGLAVEELQFGRASTGRQIGRTEGQRGMNNASAVTRGRQAV